MDWVKLAARYYDDAKIEALSDAAEVMFTRGLARAGELELGGFIPDSSLPKLARRRRYATLVEELVASGLWSRVCEGIQVTRWADWQGALDDLAKRRTTDRERQRRRRERLKEAESTESRDIGFSSRDVTATEEELDRDLGGTSRIDTHYARAREPSPKCTEHTETRNPPNCGACADARRRHDEWRTERDERQRLAAKCRVHRGQLAHNCALCRSEELNPA